MMNPTITAMREVAEYVRAIGGRDLRTPSRRNDHRSDAYDRQMKNKRDRYAANQECVIDDEDENAASTTLADFGLHQLESLDNQHQHAYNYSDASHTPLLRNHHMEEIPSSIHQLYDSKPNVSSSQNIDLNADNIGFIILKGLNLIPKNDGWALVSDLDHFFQSLYNYYYMRGIGSIIGKGVVELISLFFTLWLSLILFAFIDWKKLSLCNDESTCKESFMKEYVIQKPFSMDHSFLKNVWIIIYFLLFSTYGLFCLIQFGYTVVASMESKVFLEEVLGVSDRDLEVGKIEWSELVERMSEAQRVGRCRVMIFPFGVNYAHFSKIDGVKGSAERYCQSEDKGIVCNNTHDDDGHCHLIVAQRIMRRENFMIAFFNKGLLDLTIPQLPSWAWPFSIWTTGSREEKRVFFSKSIEWSIYFCVLNYMFNHSRKIRPAFYADPSSLRRRFILCGVAHAIFMPFLLFFMTLHFFMLNVYDWQSSKEYLGPREWSAVAQWKFREFNELPHVFERRMEPSYKPASAYLEMFSKPSPVKVAAGRLLVFISGSLGTLILVFAAMNDAILLHVKIGQWNLLWYAGVLGACFSIGKGILPKKTNPYFGHARRNLIVDMNMELERVAIHTHYFPDAWRGKGCDDKTKACFGSMFQYKAQHFAMEIVSIMVAPLILCISLPGCADDLCRFVRESKVEVASVGDVIGHCTFDFDTFEDENWSGKGAVASCVVTRFNSSIDQSLTLNTRPKTRHGKMEKSFFNFKNVYPHWKLPPSGKILVDMVETFCRQQENAYAHERRLHIDAALAQLETLRLLENEREKKAIAGKVGSIYDRLGDSTGPDSGGGEAVNVVDTNEFKDAKSFRPFSKDAFYPRVHFASSVHSIAPPTHAFDHSEIIQGWDSEIKSQQGMHYSEAGLSMELKKLLDRSSLVDPTASSELYSSEQSFTGSLVPVNESSLSVWGMQSDQQYMWLERFHKERAQRQYFEESNPCVNDTRSDFG